MMALEGTIRRISDEMEIKNLVLKAAVYSDTIVDMDEFLEKYIQVFSEDCVWIFHPVFGQPDTAPFRGHADIMACGQPLAGLSRSGESQASRTV